MVSGCEHSYPEEKIHHHLQEICLKEYGIERVDIKIVGKTMGVYLPLQKLFSTDIEEILASGRVQDMASLLQLSPEALDQVEDVLFSTSRVILSTEKPLDFYVLKATDTESTGITLMLVGYVQDIKRVRFWDIPRSEYRKRVFHDLRVNYPVIWKRPVDGVVKSLGKRETREILDEYFLPGANLETISPVFYSLILEAQLKADLSYEILDLRATSGRANEALVYIKVRENYKPKPGYETHQFLLPSGSESEYIFILTKYLGDFKINRVIPFYYITADGKVEKVDFPQELELAQNLEKWQQEFELEEIFLEDFLAQQITRRVQALLAEDERIQNTFASKRMVMSYVSPLQPGQEAGYFSLQVKALPKKMDLVGEESVIQNEDMLYLLGVVMRETMAVLHGYWFEHYEHVKIEPIFGSSFVLQQPDLELYRKKKIDISQLLERSMRSALI